MAHFIEVNIFDESQFVGNQKRSDSELRWESRAQVNLDQVAYIVPVTQTYEAQERGRRVMMEIVFINGSRLLVLLDSQTIESFGSVTTAWNEFFAELSAQV